MAISDDLFLAILAMDSYNRGYGEGLKLVSGATHIGTAQIGISEGGETAQQISFFAQAYTWNGQTVISYRGTDQILPDPSQWLLNSDVLQGWGMGIGSPVAGTQASTPFEMAAR